MKIVLYIQISKDTYLCSHPDTECYTVCRILLSSRNVYHCVMVHYISFQSWNILLCIIFLCRTSPAIGTHPHSNLQDKLEENPVYSIPFQDQGGAIHISKNVSYAATLSNSGATHGKFQTDW